MSNDGEAYTKSETKGYYAQMVNVVAQNGPGGNSSSDTSVKPYYVLLGTTHRNGFKNPHWRDQIKQRVTATTELSGDDFDGEFERDLFFGNATTRSSNGTITSYAATGLLQYEQPGDFTVPSDVIQRVHNRAVSKFNASIIAAQSSDNLTGRSIKHFKHDLHSLIHPMSGIQSKISQYLTRLEKIPYGKLKGPSLLSTISSAYLEFKFGVAPFAEDVSAIVGDMIIADRMHPPVARVKGYASETYSSSNDIMTIGPSTDQFGSLFQPRQHRKLTLTYSERYIGGVSTRLGSDGRIGILASNRLLPKDWAPTLFSIIPYAWMVNYFTNIREIIDAHSISSADLVWGQFTAHREMKLAYGNAFTTQQPFDPSNPFNPSLTNLVCGGGSATLVFKSFARRGLIPGELIPTLEFTIPTGPTPWVNMMAAFGGRIAKIVSKIIP